MVNVYDKVSGKLLVTFSQNVSPEGESKWEELSISLTATKDVFIEVICENKGALPVFFDNLEVKVQAVPTVLVVQENHYMPFGLGMKGLDWVLPTNAKEDKYSFQSKEKQTDFDLNISDFEARGYDYQINRTWQIDPHAESYYSSSPYSFLGNNPLFFTDPTGKDIIPSKDFNNSRYAGVYKKLQSNATFNTISQKFTNPKTSKEYHLNLNYNPLGVDKPDAITEFAVKSKSGKTDYNSDIKNLTEIGMVATMLHETQHASFFVNGSIWGMAGQVHHARMIGATGDESHFNQIYTGIKEYVKDNKLTKEGGEEYVDKDLKTLAYGVALTKEAYKEGNAKGFTDFVNTNFEGKNFGQKLLNWHRHLNSLQYEKEQNKK